MSWLFHLQCVWLAGSVLATVLTVRRIRERRAARHHALMQHPYALGQ